MKVIEGVQSQAIQFHGTYNEQNRRRQPQPHFSVRAAGISGDVDSSSIGKISLVGHYH